MPADAEFAQSLPDEPTVPWPAPTLSGDLVGLLDRLAETIVDALGFGAAVVNLAGPDGALKVVSVVGDEGARAALLGTEDSADRWDKILALSEPWGALCFIDHRNEAATVETFSWIPDTEAVADEQAWHPRDALFAPLVAGDGSRLGVLSVDLPRDGRRPSPTTCRALEAFAISAALAIEHATLRERAEASEARYRALATQDQLTGIANRSSIIEEIDLSSRRRRRDERLAALAFLDLDGFKQINDRYSHGAGDHVLQTVAGRLQSQLRPSDRVARWGGDEFLVLLHDLESATDAVAVLERLAAVVATPISYQGHQLRLTASVGVAFVNPQEEPDLDDLVRKADAAMYQVKRAGRNAIVVHDPTTEPDEDAHQNK